MEGIEARYGGNGVEARARKPLANVDANERTNQSDLIETC
jgi:hypothetical protein